MRLANPFVTSAFFAALAIAAFLQPSSALAQTDTDTVTIDVVIVDDLTPKPVPLTDFRITSDKPDAPPITVRTDEMGHISVKLEPGTYTIESARSVSLKGRSFSWKKAFSLTPGKDFSLKLTDADASLGKASGARQVSDEAGIYTQYRAGVVTVEADMGHGSGFVVDASGLILTNQHVVNGSHWLAVRFGPGIRVKASVVLEDAASDTAVIRINPAAVKNLTPLVLADPSTGPISVVGEKVLAIGSPLHQESVLTTGIVSKVEQDVLISDVNINHGNSGGPLLNLAGEVIGITTFGDMSRQGGPGISGIVAITKALPILQRARTLPVSNLPDAHLLPDISPVAFPTDVLDAAASKEIKPHEFKAPHNFTTMISTPVIVASQQGAFERLMEKASKHRTARLAAEQQRNASGLSPHRFWERFAIENRDPVVTITVQPVLRESGPSVAAGFLGAMAGVRTRTKLEYHSDFYNMELYRDGQLIEPVRRFCVPVQVFINNAAIVALDQAHAGVYVYDPSAFEPGATITMRVRDSSNLTKYETLTLDGGTVRKIWDDFAAYRSQPVKAQ